MGRTEWNEDAAQRAVVEQLRQLRAPPGPRTGRGGR